MKCFIDWLDLSQCRNPLWMNRRTKKMRTFTCGGSSGSWPTFWSFLALEAVDTSSTLWWSALRILLIWITTNSRGLRRTRQVDIKYLADFNWVLDLSADFHSFLITSVNVKLWTFLSPNSGGVCDVFVGAGLSSTIWNHCRIRRLSSSDCPQVAAGTNLCPFPGKPLHFPLRTVWWGYCKGMTCLWT